MEFKKLHICEADPIPEMKKRGYASTYINRHRTIVSQILAGSLEHDWRNYADVWNWYRETYCSKTYLHEIRAVIGNIEAFHLHGQYPTGKGMPSSLCSSWSSYDSLNEEYKSLVNFYSGILKDRHVRDTTLYSDLHKSASFLLDLQNQGEDRLCKVTEKGVLRCFLRDGERIRGASCARIVKNLFNSCGGFSPECTRIVPFVPLFRQDRKNIQYLKPDEIVKLRAVLDDKDNGLSAKDRAIGMMLLYTGIRGCDIAAMTLDEVIWEEDVIRFSQQKTLKEVELPLIPIVGNAIYDYCVNERPRNECRQLFLGDTAPHHGLTTDGIGTAVQRWMDAAGIRQGKGDRRGTHIFRHRFVTSMLDNEVATPVISNVLGHSSPKSLEAYLYADIEHLRTCSLSIDEYSVPKGVFAHD